MVKYIFRILILGVLCTILIVNISLSINVDMFKPGIDSGASSIGSVFIGAINILATIVAIATLAILGIRFMLASPSAKADIKAQSVPYIIGAVIIFSIIPILNIFWNIFAVGPNGGISGTTEIEPSNDGGGNGCRPRTKL